jgi:polysaccharide biosynthesis/export protein
MPSGLFRRALALALCAGAMTFGSCKHDEAFVWVDDLPDPPATPASEYVIAPGDVLSVRVWNQNEMSARVRVRSDGKISLPFVNDVMAAGFKPSVLASQIQVRVKDFLTNPVVTVSLEEIKPATVSLLGEVAKPGQYPMEPGARILQALASAGGLTDYAHKDRIFVLRDLEGRPIRIRFDYATLTRASGRAAEFRLQSGDVLVVE